MAALPPGGAGRPAGPAAADETRRPCGGAAVVAPTKFPPPTAAVPCPVTALAPPAALRPATTVAESPPSAFRGLLVTARLLLWGRGEDVLAIDPTLAAIDAGRANATSLSNAGVASSGRKPCTPSAGARAAANKPAAVRFSQFGASSSSSDDSTGDVLLLSTSIDGEGEGGAASTADLVPLLSVVGGTVAWLGKDVAFLTCPEGQLVVKFTDAPWVDAAAVAAVLGALVVVNTSADPTHGTRVVALSASSPHGVDFGALAEVDFFAEDEPTQWRATTQRPLVLRGTAPPLGATPQVLAQLPPCIARVGEAIELIDDDTTFFGGGWLSVAVADAAAALRPEMEGLSVDAAVVPAAAAHTVAVAAAADEGAVATLAPPPQGAPGSNRRPSETAAGRRSLLVPGRPTPTGLSLVVRTGPPPQQQQQHPKFLQSNERSECGQPTPGASLVTSSADSSDSSPPHAVSGGPPDAPCATYDAYYDGFLLGVVWLGQGLASARSGAILTDRLFVGFAEGGTATLDALKAFLGAVVFGTTDAGGVVAAGDTGVVHVDFALLVGSTVGRRDLEGNALPPTNANEPLALRLTVARRPSLLNFRAPPEEARTTDNKKKFGGGSPVSASLTPPPSPHQAAKDKSWKASPRSSPRPAPPLAQLDPLALLSAAAGPPSPPAPALFEYYENSGPAFPLCCLEDPPQGFYGAFIRVDLDEADEGGDAHDCLALIDSSARELLGQVARRLRRPLAGLNPPAGPQAVPPLRQRPNAAAAAAGGGKVVAPPPPSLALKVTPIEGPNPLERLAFGPRGAASRSFRFGSSVSSAADAAAMMAASSTAIAAPPPAGLAASRGGGGGGPTSSATPRMASGGAPLVSFLPLLGNNNNKAAAAAGASSKQPSSFAAAASAASPRPSAPGAAAASTPLLVATAAPPRGSSSSGDGPARFAESRALLRRHTRLVLGGGELEGETPADLVGGGGLPPPAPSSNSQSPSSFGGCPSAGAAVAIVPPSAAVPRASADATATAAAADTGHNNEAQLLRPTAAAPQEEEADEHRGRPLGRTPSGSGSRRSFVRRGSVVRTPAGASGGGGGSAEAAALQALDRTRKLHLDRQDRFVLLATRATAERVQQRTARLEAYGLDSTFLSPFVSAFRVAAAADGRSLGTCYVHPMGRLVVALTPDPAGTGGLPDPAVRAMSIFSTTSPGGSVVSSSAPPPPPPSAARSSVSSSADSSGGGFATPELLTAVLEHIAFVSSNRNPLTLRRTLHVTLGAPGHGASHVALPMKIVPHDDPTEVVLAATRWRWRVGASGRVVPLVPVFPKKRLVKAKGAGSPAAEPQAPSFMTADSVAPATPPLLGAPLATAASQTAGPPPPATPGSTSLLVPPAVSPHPTTTTGGGGRLVVPPVATTSSAALQPSSPGSGSNFGGGGSRQSGSIVGGGAHVRRLSLSNPSAAEALPALRLLPAEATAITDPDTEHWDGGVLRVAGTTGAAAGDRVGLLSVEQQQLVLRRRSGGGHHAAAVPSRELFVQLERVFPPLPLFVASPFAGGPASPSATAATPPAAALSSGRGRASFAAGSESFGGVPPFFVLSPPAGGTAAAGGASQQQQHRLLPNPGGSDGSSLAAAAVLRERDASGLAAADPAVFAAVLRAVPYFLLAGGDAAAFALHHPIGLAATVRPPATQAEQSTAPEGPTGGSPLMPVISSSFPTSSSGNFSSGSSKANRGADNQTEEGAVPPPAVGVAPLSTLVDSGALSPSAEQQQPQPPPEWWCAPGAIFSRVHFVDDGGAIVLADAAVAVEEPFVDGRLGPPPLPPALLAAGTVQQQPPGSSRRLSLSPQTTSPPSPSAAISSSPTFSAAAAGAGGADAGSGGSNCATNNAGCSGAALTVLFRPAVSVSERFMTLPLVRTVAGAVAFAPTAAHTVAPVLKAFAIAIADPDNASRPGKAEVSVEVMPPLLYFAVDAQKAQLQPHGVVQPLLLAAGSPFPPSAGGSPTNATFVLSATPPLVPYSIREALENRAEPLLPNAIISVPEKERLLGATIEVTPATSKWNVRDYLSLRFTGTPFIFTNDGLVISQKEVVCRAVVSQANIRMEFSKDCKGATPKKVELLLGCIVFSIDVKDVKEKDAVGLYPRHLQVVVNEGLRDSFGRGDVQTIPVTVTIAEGGSGPE